MFAGCCLSATFSAWRKDGMKENSAHEIVKAYMDGMELAKLSQTIQ